MVIIRSWYCAGTPHLKYLNTPHDPFTHPVLFSSMSPLPVSTLLTPSFTLNFRVLSRRQSPHQGEAICSGNPLLILAQRSWKMYSRQTVGRGRSVLGPQQVPGFALMEHYFHPFHPSIPPLHIRLLSRSLRLVGLLFFFIIPSYSKTQCVHILFPSIHLSIYLNYLWKQSSLSKILMQRGP